MKTEIKTQTEEELTKQVQDLKIALSVVKEQLKNSKVVKEISGYFINKDGKFIKYSNLSETKKYFEANNEDLLKALLVKHNKTSINSKEFHEILISELSK